MTSLATKDYRPGEVVMTSERPLAVALLTAYRSQSCSFCLSTECTNGLRRCASCLVTWYCSKECQRADWSTASPWGVHKWECPALRSWRDDGNGSLSEEVDMFLLPLRLALLQFHRRDVASKKVTLHNGGERGLDDLMTHSEDFRRDESVMKEFQHFVRLCRLGGLDYLVNGDNQHPDEEILWTTFCRDRINSVNVTDSMERLLGEALYLDLSVLDHSCVPNVGYVFAGGTRLVVRTLHEVATGLPLLINYIPLEWSATKRRVTLSDRYRFACHCPRCDVIADPARFQLDEKNSARLRSLKQKMISRSQNCQTEYTDGRKLEDEDANQLEVFRLFSNYVHIWDELLPGPHPVRSLSHFTAVIALLQCHASRNSHALQTRNKRRTRTESTRNLNEDEGRFVHDLNDHLRTTHGQDHSLYRLYLAAVCQMRNLMRH